MLYANKHAGVSSQLECSHNQVCFAGGIVTAFTLYEIESDTSLFYAHTNSIEAYLHMQRTHDSYSCAVQRYVCNIPLYLVLHVFL